MIKTVIVDPREWADRNWPDTLAWFDREYGADGVGAKVSDAEFPDFWNLLMDTIEGADA